jgi:hypothetical protein
VYRLTREAEINVEAAHRELALHSFSDVAKIKRCGWIPSGLMCCVCVNEDVVLCGVFIL